MFVSCSMQKKVYSLGYHIQLNKTERKDVVGGGNNAENTRQCVPKKTVISKIHESSCVVTQAAPISHHDNCLINLESTREFEACPFEEKLNQSISPNQIPRAYSFLSIDERNTVISVQNVQKMDGDLEENNRSWIIAFLLCFFLGYLGLHRFYLGYPVVGVIQLLTVGFFGFWWFFDFIRILTRSLKPKNGKYTT